jgi:hypothetical protein
VGRTWFEHVVGSNTWVEHVVKRNEGNSEDRRVAVVVAVVLVIAVMAGSWRWRRWQDGSKAVVAVVVAAGREEGIGVNSLTHGRVVVCKVCRFHTVVERQLALQSSRHEELDNPVCFSPT